MPHKLNPHIETLFLLLNVPWKTNKEKALKELEATGVDASAFYSRNGAVISRYYAAFEKEMAASLGTELLSQAESLLQGIYFHLVWHHPQWVESMEAVPDEDLSEAVMGELMRALEGQQDIIAALENLGVSDQSKWQAMVLMQKPRQQLDAVFTAVSANLAAYEAAQAKVSRYMGHLLAQFDKLAETTYGRWPLDLSRLLDASAPIIPTLAMPFSVLYTDDAFFCGLLCYKLLRGASDPLSRDELVVCAKALSDKSKVAILLCLKNESLFGLEIAERMGLTPATVSYHMGTLLAAGFVEVEKKGGKTFYRLSQTGMKKFLSGTSQLFLLGD